MTKVYDNWADYPLSEWRWPNFSPQEMACRGTGKLMIVPTAMDKLQALRDALGKPMIVNSAYRSPEHNMRVEGATRSKHMQGLAFDVRMDNHNPATYIEAAQKVGFKAIGTYPAQGFVHVDNRPVAASWGTPFPSRVTPSFAMERPREAETLVGSTTLQATVVAVVSGGSGVLASVASLAPTAQYIVIGCSVVALLSLAWIARERIKRMAG